MFLPPFEDNVAEANTSDVGRDFSVDYILQ